jgi:peptidyl-prolyl cis-trans isomerase B (cyclophilin B)
MRKLPFAAAALAALVLAPDARAQETKVDVTVAPKKAEVELGSNIELEVTVKNVGKDAAELTELTFDRQSVSFELTPPGAKKPFKDVQIHDSTRMPKAYPKKSVKAGEALTKTFTVPAVAAGEWEVVALYSGAGRNDLGSEPVKVKVKEKDGATEVCAKMRTNIGPMTIRFFPTDALGHVLNFVRLAKDGFYDGVKFHRVVRAPTMGVVQGGDPKGDGSGGPGYNIPAEFNDKEHIVGRISMARQSDPDSAGSQFFLCTKQCKDLDKRYTVFGEVVKGLDVLASMGGAKITGGEDGPPVDKLIMESVRIEPLPKE